MKQNLQRIKVIILVLILAVALFFVLPLQAADRGEPEPGSLPLDETGQMQISPGDRCPVCAMMVKKHKKFASAIQLEDGTTYYFCGTGCMIRTWLHPEVFLAKEKSQLKKPVVRAYFTGEALDARAAFWVAGSDIVGPMGPALVPLKSEENVDVFRRRHGGKSVFRLEELTDDRWLAITGKPAVP
ncbi:MAG: nitrous oxide reductase accessory protein NosL [Desulfobacterales bacterium]|nr:nitrous oxide reductase accessory protein NosL [Desulfobacterales bacterium]